MFESFLKQRGQISILFALLMPIFLLIVGVGLDLGWYYLNVSRLQNAADAAAVAGAQTLINNENFSDYKSVTLTSKYPGKVSEQYRTAETAKIEAISESRDAAKEYVAKNLSSNEGNIINSWTHEKVETETPTLYEKDDNLYFVVQLREEIKHFFLPGWFDDMTAPVTAVALLTKKNSNTPSTPDMPSKPEDPSAPDMPTKPAVLSETADEELIKNLTTLRNDNVIVGNWEVQNEYRQNKKYADVDETGNPITGKVAFKALLGHDLYGINGEKWNYYSDFYENENRSKKSHYTSGEHRRTETVYIEPNNSGGNNRSSFKTDANGGKIYKESEVDSLDIDFKWEVQFNPKSQYVTKAKDWDFTLDNAYADVDYMPNIDYGNDIKFNKDELNPAFFMRIHATLNFDEPHKARVGYQYDDPDILWVRIESEPMYSEPDLYREDDDTKQKQNGKSYVDAAKGSNKLAVFNSPRQIILNFNKSNYDTNAQKYRPVVIFYSGPERYDTSDPIRESRPVIVNLNADFRGILYMPNSPVVLNGNGKNFNGFIVAKKYLRLRTKFYEDSDRYYESAFDRTEYFKITDEHGNVMFIDEHGEVQYEELDTPLLKYGTYDTFNRTELSSANYDIAPNLAYNMLLSGK